MLDVKLTDRRVARTLKTIENAFLEVLNRKTLQKLTIQDITEAANINRSTFYEYFTDKFAIFNHIVRKTFQDKMLEHLTGDYSAYAAEHLEQIIEATCEYFQSLNALCPPSDRELRPIAEAQVQVVLYEALTCWYPPEKEQEPSVIALFVSWAIFGTLLDAVANGKIAHVQEVKQRVLTLTRAVLEAH